MGGCQGKPGNYNCEERVAAIVARELGVKAQDVGRRPWPGSSILASRWFDDDERDHLRAIAADGLKSAGRD